ncbi:MAG: DAK2 domain-containing protein, partial [Arthrobacter sp.]
DEMGDSVIMSQVGGAAAAEGKYRWRVHVHVPAAEPAVALIGSLGEPSDISVSQLALPRDPELRSLDVRAPGEADAEVLDNGVREPSGHER